MSERSERTTSERAARRGRGLLDGLDRMTGVAALGDGSEIVVDRIACTGHGVCARLLAPVVTLDEWGYPIVATPRVDPAAGAAAVRLCPARALRWRRPAEP